MMASTDVLLQAAPVVGRGVARAAGAADAIDGVVPTLIVEPDTPEAVAAVLAWASRDRLSLVLRGGGTRLGWGRPPASIDVVLSMRRLNRVLAHQHGDLTAVVEAGAAVEEVNRSLAAHRQWLPLDAPFEGATIGGTVATNDSGPLRHRYGSARDQLIGIRLATADGRLVKAGGNVVKNVAGYDLGKLVSGSFGTLAAIVSATFKLAPIPPDSRTIAIACRTASEAAQAIGAIAGSQLEPAAFEVHAAIGSAAAGGGTAYRLFLRFATAPGAVEAQIAQVQYLAAGNTSDIVLGDADRALWHERVRGPWRAAGAVIRVSWLPASIGAVLELLDDLMRGGATGVELAGRAALGSGLLRVEGSGAAQAAAVERVRSRPDVCRHVVLLRADADVKARVDVWGPPGDAGPLAAAVKRALDPAGILNAGRGPV